MASESTHRKSHLAVNVFSGCDVIRCQYQTYNTKGNLKAMQLPSIYKVGSLGSEQ